MELRRAIGIGGEKLAQVREGFALGFEGLPGGLFGDVHDPAGFSDKPAERKLEKELQTQMPRLPRS